VPTQLVLRFMFSVRSSIMVHRYVRHLAIGVRPYLGLRMSIVGRSCYHCWRQRRQRNDGY